MGKRNAIYGAVSSASEISDGLGKLILAGHSHIDTAWLWPLRGNAEVRADVFNRTRVDGSVPGFISRAASRFSTSESRRTIPSCSRVKRVKEGRWELCGAPWVEPDHNMPTGEALIRQYLYGNRWFEREFGKRSHIAWVPDSFGYTWSLPQIMRKVGLTAFVTTKIDWSQYTQFPYNMFEWEGVDGTRIFAVMPPLNYNGNPVPKECIAQWAQFKQKEFAEEIPFAFGWGDGGGGPTMGMIEHGWNMRCRGGYRRPVDIGEWQMWYNGGCIWLSRAKPAAPSATIARAKRRCTTPNFSARWRTSRARNTTTRNYGKRGSLS